MSKEVEEKVVLSDEEKLMVEASREADQRKKDCVKELNVILKKYKCSIGVNPNSTIGNPQIFVTSG